MMKLVLIFFICNITYGRDCLQELTLFSTPKANYIQLADHFKVYEFSGYILVKTIGQRGETEQFLLSDDMTKIVSLCPGTKKFKIPLTKIVVTSTTHIPPFELLGGANNLVAVTNTKLVSSPLVVKRIKAGMIGDTGYPINPELILSFKADLLITYSVESKELEGISRLEKMGLPTVANYDFLEKHPLKRAEWLKFAGLFLNKKDEAAYLFEAIRKKYLGLKRKIKSKKRPIVIAGKSSGGVWYAPGGVSDFAKMIKDAGGKYIWDDNRSTRRITKNIEEVYSRVSKVDYWFPQNNWLRIRDALREDSRFKNFLLLKNCYVYNFTKKINTEGGNDYWETALMRPDLLLEDLIAVLHPEVLPYHKMRWYQELK